MNNNEITFDDFNPNTNNNENKEVKETTSNDDLDLSGIEELFSISEVANTGFENVEEGVYEASLVLKLDNQKLSKNFQIASGDNLGRFVFTTDWFNDKEGNPKTFVDKDGKTVNWMSIYKGNLFRDVERYGFNPEGKTLFEIVEVFNKENSGVIKNIKVSYGPKDVEKKWPRVTVLK